ncbi:MAG: hypothetical protein F4112_15935 [Holophagales bacterium]|nr:hypothetical protein [Holophagales bacterium]MYB20870.1 hypothetical protein [Holophagales bacterium]MYD21128.1 hypothetical protein [Holophagales bacterium]MYH25511.1 hypothetical protein [Holophagales bacterium]MYI34439.1 hypothetical protein [Holophagales bacterium]
MTLGRIDTDPGAELRRDLNDHLEAVGRRFDVLDARLDAVDSRFNQINSRLDAHDRQLAELTEMLRFVAQQHGWTDPDDGSDGEPPPIVW